MTSRAPITFRHIVTRPLRSHRVDTSLQPNNFPPERYSDLGQSRGELISVPEMFASSETGASASQSKLTKLLLNVNIERSLGPVQVIMAPENTVKDLIKAVIEIYVKEKRRPFLINSNPDCFALHYSQFSFESLKADEKLINLGSRNFFMCLKTSNTITTSCSKEANLANKSTFY
ncbi:uncharacterized protein LOC126677870 [Mercurialis annua]|uniref:uncharacterized protein LOC126677870 n=1 Tax=Mercurialis annua TaxID=3986 RepID=UPI00215FB1B3|nr:uncharacterized protein LOC126677870 [Mercurialis annua]